MCSIIYIIFITYFTLKIDRQSFDRFCLSCCSSQFSIRHFFLPTNACYMCTINNRSICHFIRQHDFKSFHRFIFSCCSSQFSVYHLFFPTDVTDMGLINNISHILFCQRCLLILCWYIHTSFII